MKVLPVTHFLNNQQNIKNRHNSKPLNTGETEFRQKNNVPSFGAKFKMSIEDIKRVVQKNFINDNYFYPDQYNLARWLNISDDYNFNKILFTETKRNNALSPQFHKKLKQHTSTIDNEYIKHHKRDENSANIAVTYPLYKITHDENILTKDKTYIQNFIENNQLKNDIAKYKDEINRNMDKYTKGFNEEDTRLIMKYHMIPFIKYVVADGFRLIADIEAKRREPFTQKVLYQILENPIVKRNFESFIHLHEGPIKYATDKETTAIMRFYIFESLLNKYAKSLEKV